MRTKKGSALDTDLPTWLQLFTLDFPSGGHEETCSRTAGASLCKHFENLELLLQPVMLSDLSVLQLADRLYPTLTWPLVITSLWPENFPFSCHRSHQMLHLPGCFCFRQLCFHILEFGGVVHMHNYHSEKNNEYDISVFVFSCLHLQLVTCDSMLADEI